MDASLKIVTRLPLQELWRDNGCKTTARIKSVTEDDIRNLLRSGPVQFVVVDVGTVPTWIEVGECFRFWKAEVQSHLASDTTALLDNFPGRYCYFASQ